MTPEQHEVRRYYERLGTWLGYDLVLGGAKHLGFYPSAQKDRSEQAARSCMHDEIARRLRLKVGQHILDAGCGQGIASVDIAKRYGVHVTGITIVPFEATRARRHARRHEVTHHTDYQVMDYSSTSFPADHFDAIYTNETLSHSPHPAATLREMRRILKPGGRIAFEEYTIAPDDAFPDDLKRAWGLIITGSAMHGLRQFRHVSIDSRTSSILPS